jgi:PAS domain S-box-containing protein
MKLDAKSQSSANTGKSNGSTTSSQKHDKNPELGLEKRFQRAVDAGRIFSWEMNPATRKLEWSNNMEAVIGFPMFDNIDKTFELFHPDDYQSTVDQINEAIETGGEYESEYRLVNPANGEVFWFHSQGAMMTDTVDGSPRFSGITQNITERKQNEEALCESQAQIAADLAGMRRLYDLQSRLAVQTDVKAALADVLAVACDFTGTDRGCVQLLSDDRERLEMAVWQGYADDSPFIEFFRYEGFENGCEVTRVQRQRLIIEETIGFPGLDRTEAGAAAYADGIRAAQSTPMTNRLGYTIGVISTQFREPHRPNDHELRLMDMLAWTAAEFLERYRAEEVLRESEERLRIALEAAELGTWEWNLETEEVKCNERHLQLFGIEPQENSIKLETLIRNVHEEDRVWMENQFVESAKATKSQRLFDGEFRVRLETGEIRWTDGYGKSVEVSGEKTIRMIGVTSDITARKRAEEALRQSEEHSRLTKAPK